MIESEADIMRIPESPWRVVIFCGIADLIPHDQDLINRCGHKLVGLVAAPGPQGHRTEDYLEVAQYARPGLDVIISNYPNRWADMIRPLRPDLIWVAGFNWKIPQSVVDLPRLGAVNGHPALLPKYRGANAIGWALRHDEPEIGFTYHYLAPEFDAGPILSQERIPVLDDDYSWDQLQPKLGRAYEDAALAALDRIAAGDVGTPQDESEASYAGGAFEPAWREIDWSDTARHTFVKVRSWTGIRDTPRGAFGDIDGQRCLIKATRLTHQASTEVEPGTVLERRSDGTLLIQCGDGPLELLEWSNQINGEETDATPR